MSETMGGDAAKAKSLEKPGRFESTMAWGIAAYIVFFLFNTLLFILLMSPPGNERSFAEILAELFSFGDAWYVFWVPTCGGAALVAFSAAPVLSKKAPSTRAKAISLIASVFLDIIIVIGLLIPLFAIIMFCGHGYC